MFHNRNTKQASFCLGQLDNQRTCTIVNQDPAKLNYPPPLNQDMLLITYTD